MASIATSSLLPVLGEPHKRKATALEATLQDLVSLAIIGKQLHWVVIGPFFTAVSSPLGRAGGFVACAVRPGRGARAALGYGPDGQAQAVSANSQLDPVGQPPIKDHAGVRALIDRIASVSELARGRMDRLGDIELASQEVQIEVVRKLEEQQWMLRAQLLGRSCRDWLERWIGWIYTQSRGSCPAASART